MRLQGADEAAGRRRDRAALAGQRAQSALPARRHAPHRSANARRHRCARATAPHAARHPPASANHSQPLATTRTLYSALRTGAEPVAR